MKTKLQDLLKENKLQKAFEVLNNIIDLQEGDTKKEIILIQNRFSRNQEDYNKGVLDRDKYNLECNHISLEFLSILDKIQFPNSKKEKTLLSNNPIDKKESLPLDYELLNKFSHLINECSSFMHTLYQRQPAYSGIDDFAKELKRIDQKFKTKKFQVAVLALIKSGKSTLLNACIGQEFLPANSQAETMSIVRLKHKEGEKEGILTDGDKKVKGIEYIRAYLKNLNESARVENKAIKTELTLEVELDIWKDKKLGEYQFDILDTPGVNEAGVDTLFSTVEKLIKETDVIIYLLDFTKLKTKDEDNIFADIKKYRENLLADYKDRLFFVVNKFDLQDRHDRERQMDEKKLKLHVQNLLQKQNIEVETNKIVVLMAKRAFECRAVKNDVCTKEQLYDFKDWAYGFGNGDKKIAQSSLNKKADVLIKQTGLSALEKAIFDTIYSKRATIFFQSIKDDLSRWCDMVANQLNTSLATLQKDKIEIDSLKNKVDKIVKEVTTLIAETRTYQKKTKNLIESKIISFDKIVTQNINAAFSFWENLSVKKIFGDILYSLISQLSGEETNVIENLRNADAHIRQQIGLETKQLWREISQDLYAKSIELNQKLLNKAQQISQEIEKVIGEELKIELAPISIKVPNIDLREYESNFIQNLNKLVKTKTYLFGIFKLPWDFGFEIPFLAKQKYTLSKSEYKQFLMEQLIKPMIQSSKELADEIVQTQMTDVLNNVRNTLVEYGNRYIETISQEIEMKQQGNVDIEERIETLIYDISTINQIKKL